MFVVLYLVCFIGFGYISYRSKSSLTTNASMSLASLFLVLFASEAVLSTRVEPGAVYPPGYFAGDPELGYRLGADVDTRIRKSYGDGRVIYDIEYGFDRNGLRRVAGGTGPNADTVVFFGCSVTFGEGVGDKETLPHYFSDLTGYEYKIVNFGFHGYGPHQMLRRLELGRVGPLVDGELAHAFYLGLPDHLYRLAGYRAWDLSGPAYELTAAGDVVYTGPFYPKPVTLLIKAVLRSRVMEFAYNSAVTAWVNTPAARRDLVATYLAILKESSEILEAEHGVPLTVLFWPDGTPLAEYTAEQLKRTGLDVLDLSEVIPPEEQDAYRLRGDPHPSPEAYRKIAEAVVGRLGGGNLHASPARSPDRRSPACDRAACRSKTVSRM